MKDLKITTENAEFQIIESLKMNRAKRSKHNEIFIEGIESIKQAVTANVRISRIITSDLNSLSGWAEQVIARHIDAKVIEMSNALYKKLCDRKEPSEIVVTAHVVPLKVDRVKLSDKPFVLIFDRPSDHGNFGSIIRSANAFSVDAIFVVGHGIDVYDPKVIRSSLGSIFHSQIVYIQSTEELLTWIKEQKNRNGIRIVGTDSTGNESLLTNRLQRPIAVILGNEAKGMSVALKEICDCIISIPISGNVNSLNVSCAGSIILWDVYKHSKIT